MQSPTDPADRTGTIGVEAFDAAYGPASRRRTTHRTPSSASWSRTAGRSSRPRLDLGEVLDLVGFGPDDPEPVSDSKVEELPLLATAMIFGGHLNRDVDCDSQEWVGGDRSISSRSTWLMRRNTLDSGSPQTGVGGLGPEHAQQIAGHARRHFQLGLGGVHAKFGGALEDGVSTSCAPGRVALVDGAETQLNRASAAVDLPYVEIDHSWRRMGETVGAGWPVRGPGQTVRSVRLGRAAGRPGSAWTWARHPLETRLIRLDGRHCCSRPAG